MFKPIKNRNGTNAYIVSADGKHIFNAKSGNEVSQWFDKKDKRYKVTIYLNGHKWTTTNYRLVAMAYLHNGYSYNSNIDIHHVDLNRDNCHYSNLRPMTKEAHEKLHRMIEQGK